MPLSSEVKSSRMWPSRRRSTWGQFQPQVGSWFCTAATRRSSPPKHGSATRPLSLVLPCTLSNSTCKSPSVEIDSVAPTHTSCSGVKIDIIWMLTLSLRCTIPTMAIISSMPQHAVCSNQCDSVLNATPCEGRRWLAIDWFQRFVFPWVSSSQLVHRWLQLGGFIDDPSQGWFWLYGHWPNCLRCLSWMISDTGMQPVRICISLLDIVEFNCLAHMTDAAWTRSPLCSTQ